MKPLVNLMWFRRDLRLTDNAALYQALQNDRPVIPVFIFDRNILDKLEDRSDKRVCFIHAAILAIQAELKSVGSSIEVYHGFPEKVFTELADTYDIGTVYTNHDYEPYAKQRDLSVKNLLAEKGVGFHTCKDQVIFEKEEVCKDDGKPYTVFTPYANKWKATLTDKDLASYPVQNFNNNFYQRTPAKIPSLKEMGFVAQEISFPPKQVSKELIQHYQERRNFPSLENGTSRLGVHLRFGTISIRKLARYARELSETYLNELIWRDFYHMILWHFPRVGEGKSFKPAYDMIQWRNDENEFQRWCDGMTGYPIVDAGMRELNATGFMHNRVRMITASFLTKHLLIDWRWGEAYFAQKLLDFDLAANNGGWQWASSSGCDAAPYFRVFNPYLQTEKFDKDLHYIKKWVPEFQEFSYPQPIVQHEFARKRVLEVYAKALKP
ncbi:MAG: deoxyribodipyrimidine photo-lyase [Bacteroidota bacterium]|nr:deoxyribodipyrimidine photo-lyase [Bacteroidota bacterium]